MEVGAFGEILPNESVGVLIRPARSHVTPTVMGKGQFELFEKTLELSSKGPANIFGSLLFKISISLKH